MTQDSLKSIYATATTSAKGFWNKIEQLPIYEQIKNSAIGQKVSTVVDSAKSRYAQAKSAFGSISSSVSSLSDNIESEK